MGEAERGGEALRVGAIVAVWVVLCGFGCVVVDW